MCIRDSTRVNVLTEQGVSHRCIVRRLGLATVNLYIKYEVSMFTHYEDRKGDEKCKNCGGWGLGVTQGHRKHHHFIDRI